MSLKGKILAVCLISLLVVAAIITALVWTRMGDVSISIHGFLALGLGVLVTFALGVGLMALVFFSNRYGYDENKFVGKDKMDDI